MALLDFLGNDIGGSTPGVNDPGGLGVHPSVGNTGINWGQLLGKAMQYGSRSPMSAGLGQSLAQQYGGQQQAAANQQMLSMPNPVGQQKPSSLQSILNTLLAAYGIGT